MAGLPFRPGLFAPFLADVERARKQPPARARGAARHRAGLEVERAARAYRARLGRARAGLGRARRGRAGRRAARERETRRAAARPEAGGRCAGGGLPRGGAAAARASASPASRCWSMPACAASRRRPACSRRCSPPRCWCGDALRVTGVQLTLFHLVALLLVVGVGTNYALFFNRPQHGRDDRALMLLSLAVASLATLISASALATSGTPVLRAIGLTAAVGTVYALVLSALLAPRSRQPDESLKPLYATVLLARQRAGPRHGAGARGAARGAQRLAAQRFPRQHAGYLDRPHRRAARRCRCCDGMPAAFPTAASSGSPRPRWRRTASARRWRGRARRYGAQRIGVFLGTSSVGHAAGRARLPHARARRRRAARRPQLPRQLQHVRARRLRARAARPAGPGRGRFHRLLLERQGVRHRAARAIEAGLCDAAVVGGVDTLCLTTLHGFASLELLSREPLPALRRRSATASRSAKARPSRCSSKPDRAGEELALLGYGESADAHHMSTPHPEGLGAALAMRAALERAGLAPRRHRLHQPARHRHAQQRRRRGRGRVRGRRRRACRAARPRAGPGTRWARPARSRRCITLLVPAPRLRRRARSTRARSIRRCESQVLLAGARRAARARDDQFVRLRRQQLLARVREGRGMNSSRSGSRARACSGRGCRTGTRRATCCSANARLRGRGATRSPAPALLPANERRRASVTARWALRGGQRGARAAAASRPRTSRSSSPPAAATATIMRPALRRRSPPAPPEMSPTRFHNSVHNAPAGYWSIFARSRAPSTTLCGYDASFAAGLLEAAAQVAGRAARRAAGRLRPALPRSRCARCGRSRGPSPRRWCSRRSARGRRADAAARSRSARGAGRPRPGPDRCRGELAAQPGRAGARRCSRPRRARRRPQRSCTYLQDSHVAVEIASMTPAEDRRAGAAAGRDVPARRGPQLRRATASSAAPPAIARRPIRCAATAACPRSPASSTARRRWPCTARCNAAHGRRRAACWPARARVRCTRRATSTRNPGR